MYLFVGYLLDANALASAPLCSTPTRSSTSACLSVLDGQITYEGAVAKGNKRVTIALEDTVVDARYQCDESPGGACSAVPLRAGTAVATGWWKGNMVTFGPEGARPSIVTEFNPVDQAYHVGFFLVLVILGVSGIVAGLLLLQAPSSLGDLLRSVIAGQPHPPRVIDLPHLWRVAIGYSAWGGYLLWAFLFIFSFMVVRVLFPSDPGAVGVALVATGVASIGPALLLAPVGLYTKLRTAERRTVTVKRFRTATGRGRTVTTVWYDRTDGHEASTNLGDEWDGEVHIGDQLDALTDPGTGAVELVLSAPPA